ncbi:MAG: zinc ribbon domain-containing protein [Acidobacteria bacterium]|nr:zinc ribbon domain-containing protein [Acidobacteriota bacterium]
MALICSCGAELPDHARFCLSCGKPQRENDFVGGMTAEEPVPPAPALAPPVLSSVSFSNPIAVRVALLCASLSALLNFIPLVSFGCCLWVSGAGFLASVLYIRRTGLMLSVGDGARLGGITGLLTFVIGLVLTAFTLLAARAGGGVREALRQSMERIPAQDAVTRQMVEFLTSSAGLAVVLLSYVVLGLLLIVSLATAGGALGAKVMEKD